MHRFTAADFEPVTVTASPPLAGRPVRSYWSEVGGRLARNRRALVAIVTLLSLLLFTLAGPLLWQADPAHQSLASRSLGPVGQRSAVAVYWRPWQPQQSIGGSSIDVAAANTEFVRLQWAPVAGAASYRVERSERIGGDSGAGALTLARVTSPWYEDRLDLHPRQYRYRVVAVDSKGRELSVYRTTVQPELALTVLAAQIDGLLPADRPAASLDGRAVNLPAHPLGTDYLGRDMLARLMAGARTSLFVGVVAPLIFIVIGSAYGGISGYFGGRVDNILMRFSDFVIALPFLLFMILFKVMFGIRPGESGIAAMMIAMIMLSWPASARLVRGQLLQLREHAFVAAARVLGGGPFYIIRRHLLPNVTGVLLVSLTFAVPSAIFTEAFLSFIGLGISAPATSWGSMCRDGIQTMLSHPHELLLPAGFISLTVLAFNMLGDGLRDAFDVAVRGDSL